MARFGFSRLRRRPVPAAEDPADQPRQLWQALLAPFSLRPPQPAGPGPQPATGQPDQASKQAR